VVSEQVVWSIGSFGGRVCENPYFNLHDQPEMPTLPIHMNAVLFILYLFTFIFILFSSFPASA